MKRASLLVVVMLLAPRAARADDANAIAAEALFADARALSRDGRHAEACPKFAQSMKLEPAAGTALNLAECDVAIGKTASAWLAYRDAATLARRGGQPERESFARERASALEPKLCRLTIIVSRAAQDGADLSIRRGSEVVERAAWGIAVPVDPGTYVVTAEAPGRVAFSRTVAVAPATVDGPCSPLDLTVPALVPLLGAPPPPPPTSTGGWRGVHTLAVGLGGAGLAALVVSGVFALRARSKNSEGESQCSSTCSPSGEAEIVSAGHSADVASGVFVAGAVLVAAGVVAWLVSPTLHRGPRSALALPASSLLAF